MTKPRVLVVGSGLAGLTSAYLLRKEGCEVWLVEKSERLGFHSASVNVPVRPESTGKNSKSGTKKGSSWVVDVPMRSFQGGYYPLLISLYKHLNLPLAPTHFTFSFSRSSIASPGEQQTYFIYNGANGLSTPSLPSSAWTSISALWQGVAQFIYSTLCFILLLLLSFLSWHRLFPSLLGHDCTLTTLRRALSPLRLDAFIDDILVPIFSSVGTMTTRDVLGSPLPALLDYVHATFGTDHYALGDGCSASTVADRLVRPIQAQGPGYVRLGACIVRLTHDRGDVIATLQDGEEIAVDKVVLATQASSAKALLQMLQPSLAGNEERRVESVIHALEGVEYRETIVVTHRGRSILPCPRDIRNINFILPQPADETSMPTPALSSSSSSPYSSVPGTPVDSETLPPLAPFFATTRDTVYTMATHVVDPPRSLRNEAQVLQTTNPVMPIDRSCILGTARLERALPVRDPALFERLHPRSKSAVVYLAGSYAYPGIPLLEGCVGSAKHAAEAVLGERLDDLGGVDWSVGQGGVLGRLWRWRSRKAVI